MTYVVRYAFPPSSGIYTYVVVNGDDAVVFGPASRADCEAWVQRAVTPMGKGK